MKRIISLLLALTLMVGCVTVLSSCGEEDNGAEIAVYLGSEIYDLDPSDYFVSDNAAQFMSLLFEPLFSLNEKGKITGGEPGDQTGKEICIRSFYTPSYGWKYHLRYEPDEPEVETGTGAYIAPKLLSDIIDGKYGVWPEREEKIREMGLDYDTVQFLVNQTVKANEGL